MAEIKVAVDAMGGDAAPAEPTPEPTSEEQPTVVTRPRPDAELEAAEAKLGAHEMRREVGRSLFVAWEPPPKAMFATLSSGTLPLGPDRALDVANVSLTRETRVRLEGPNGAGKTTLLRALVASLTIPHERVLWLPQDLAPLQERLADWADPTQVREKFGL